MSDKSRMPVVVLAGNPNVGKSTIFNALTGMNQHTGNWSGKTVELASGTLNFADAPIQVVDIPGTYSLFAHSVEEEVARDYICFNKTDAVVVVCDATCLERNMNLVLQTMEIHDNVIVCVNLMDEAKRKGISVDLKGLAAVLGVPVVGTSANNKKTLDRLICTISDALSERTIKSVYRVKYPEEIERSVEHIEKQLGPVVGDTVDKRWLAMRLIDCDESFKNSFDKFLGKALFSNPSVFSAVMGEIERLNNIGIDREKFKDITVSSIVNAANEICKGTVKYKNSRYSGLDLKLDKIFTGRLTGYPIMLLLLGIVLFITVSGANFFSVYLQNFFTVSEKWLYSLLSAINSPEFLKNAVCKGIYRVLGWVVAVMLPPMAIFFPLFTILEDSGYLPRIAFNLDRPFSKCNACGKQALTMCMGLGCNAVGVTGCRIIDSSRERLLAVLTNSFVPCNGRLPQHLKWKIYCVFL